MLSASDLEVHVPATPQSSLRAAMTGRGGVLEGVDEMERKCDESASRAAASTALTSTSISPPLMALVAWRRALAAKRVVGGGDVVARARAILWVLGC
jgi:hypothetical protein